MYTLFINSTENQIDRRSLKQGIPSYVFLSSNEEECYDFSTSGPVRFILSGANTDAAKLQGIKLKLKSNKKEYTAPTLTSVESTMLVEFKENISMGVHTICLQSKDLLSMTLIPVGSITLLPESSNFLVSKSQNFSLTPNGKIILEVFECSGSTSVLFANKFGDLSGDDSELLQWRRFGTNYLVETEHYGPVYLNVDGNSKIRWMHVDESKGEGIGYYNIRTPHFFYKFHDKTTIFNIRPLVQTARNKLNITSVNLFLYISDTHRKVKEAIQCSSSAEVTKFATLKGKAI